MVWHQITYRTYVYQSHQFPLASLSALQLVETSSSLAPDGILRRWSCGVEQSADRHSICTNTLYFQESAQDSFVFTVVFCTLSFINLIRVAYVVRHPFSDFTDILQRLINCRIIIIYYYLASTTAYQSYGDRSSVAVRQAIVKSKDNAVGEDCQQDSILERSITATAGMSRFILRRTVGYKHLLATSRRLVINSYQ